MQFAPTLTADDGLRHKPARVGNHFNSPIPYPASFPAPGGGLIFFCALFLYQDKKRVWGMGGKAPYDNSPRHKPAPGGNPFTGPRPSDAPVPCWYVLGRMQFAPTLTADNGAYASAARVENHFNGPIQYPASFPAPGGSLIFFCALFLYQDKKRVWEVGGKAPHDNSPHASAALDGN